LAREKETKKERIEAQTKDCTQKCKMGSPNKRKPETLDLNPSSVTQSKSCKEMSKKPGRTPSLKEASPAATTANAR
jgi:hypothetical protein